MASTSCKDQRTSRSKKSQLYFLSPYVAFMSRVAADSSCQPLKIWGKIMQHTRHENGRRRAPRNVRNADEIRTSGVAGGLGFEPRLTESESAVLPLNYPPIGKTLSLSVASGARPVASFLVSWSARCSNVDATPAHLGHLGQLSKRERFGRCVEMS